MYYIGADYHKDIATICIQTASGNIKDEFEVEANSKGMDKVIDIMSGKKFRIMGETSEFSINLHNHLVSRGVDSILVDPKGLKIITMSDKKTDVNDARNLAKWLRLWDKHEIDLPISLILTGMQRDLRDLCRYREEIAKMKGQTLQQISAHMRIHDYTLPGGYDDFGTLKGQLMLRENFGNDLALMMKLDDYVYFSMKADQIDSKFEMAAVRTTEVVLLESIPGVGTVTAVEIMSMIVDISRFPTADKMRGYFGMASRVRDSGGKECHGHITKQGDPMMRSILTRVLNVYMLHRPKDSVSIYYQTHVDSMGKKKARMAAMNKLLDLIFAVLKRGTPYISR